MKIDAQLLCDALTAGEYKVSSCMDVGPSGCLVQIILEKREIEVLPGLSQQVLELIRHDVKPSITGVLSDDTKLVVNVQLDGGQSSHRDDAA